MVELVKKMHNLVNLLLLYKPNLIYLLIHKTLQFVHRTSI